MAESKLSKAYQAFHPKVGVEGPHSHFLQDQLTKQAKWHLIFFKLYIILNVKIEIGDKD